MCGICGIASLEGPLAPGLARTVRAMSAAIVHRGPDDEGFYDHANATLGFRRLSIIDLSGGHQPLSNEDGSCWIAFNGEVYNHHPLRARLEGLGHRFRTRSDTETIVHAWEQFGPSCVEHLEGMFAFAIFDANRNELFIARDRLGKKPLYYAVRGGALYFGSELSTLTRAAGLEVTPDRDTLFGYLMLGYAVAPATAYREIRQLEPGHWLHLQRGQVTVRQYWDVVEFDTDRRPTDQVIADLDAAVRAHVTERLESEVPLGVFLSGGVDSGLVASYMAEAMTSPVVATSVGFASAAHDELAAATASARHIGAEHHTEIVEPTLDDAVTMMVDGFGEPFADPSAIPTWHVSRMARRHVTVALSGDGGDEAFTGYTFRYGPAAIEAQIRRVVRGPIGRATAALLASVWPRSAALPRPLRLGTLLDNLAVSPADAYFADLCFLKPASAGALVGRPAAGSHRDTAVFARITETYNRCPSPSALQRTQYADLKIYLPSDVLAKVDRMSMQHSLEVRAPLLDRRLIELAFRLPTETKAPKGQGKYLLRRIAERRLAPELSRLPKKGFSPPLGDWLAGAGGRQLADDVLSPSASVRDWIDTKVLQTIFARRGEQRPGDVHALWAVWILERWLRTTRHRAAGSVEVA